MPYHYDDDKKKGTKKGGKKGGKPAEVTDFFDLYTRHNNRKQTNEQQINIFKRYAEARRG